MAVDTKKPPRLLWLIPVSPLLGRLWDDHVRAYLPRLSIAFTFLAIAAVCAAGQAQILQPIFDRVMISGDAGLLWILPFGFFFLSVGRGLSVYMQSRITIFVSGSIIFDIQQRIFSRLLHMDLDRVYADGSGNLVARFTYDLQLLRDVFTRSCVALPKDIVLLSAYLGLMFYHNALLTLIFIVAFPFIALPLIVFAKRLRKMSHGHQLHAGRITHFVSDTLRSLPSILIFGAEKAAEKHAHSEFEEARERITRTQWTRAALTPINEALGGLTIGSLLFFGGYEVMSGAMTIGQFTTFLTAMLLSYIPIRGLSGHYAHLQEGLAVIERLYDLLDYKDNAPSKEDAIPFAWKGGTIVYNNASRRQPNNTRYQFQDISLTIKPGQRIALFGASGSGKTSLINALLRFIPLDDGSIEIDGQDISALAAPTLRRHFAYVSQDILLLHGSAADNIALGDTLDEERLAKALSQARADTFLSMEPIPSTHRPQPDPSTTKLQTPVEHAIKRSVYENIGEGGNQFSGGQKQRIALARAFYRDAHIIILDEPTSALDKETEQNILANIFAYLDQRTVILITHDPANLCFVDHVVMIDDGKIIDQGAPDTMMKPAPER